MAKAPRSPPGDPRYLHAVANGRRLPQALASKLHPPLDRAAGWQRNPQERRLRHVRWVARTPHVAGRTALRRPGLEETAMAQLVMARDTVVGEAIADVRGRLPALAAEAF